MFRTLAALTEGHPAVQVRAAVIVCVAVEPPVIRARSPAPPARLGERLDAHPGGLGRLAFCSVHCVLVSVDGAQHPPEGLEDFGRGCGTVGDRRPHAEEMHQTPAWGRRRLDRCMTNPACVGSRKPLAGLLGRRVPANGPSRCYAVVGTFNSRKLLGVSTPLPERNHA